MKIKLNVWLINGLFLALVLVASEIIYIYWHKPVEYLLELKNFSDTRFGEAIEHKNYQSSWTWLKRMVWIQGELAKKNELAKGFSEEYAMPEFKTLPNWMVVVLSVSRPEKTVQAAKAAEPDLARMLIALAQAAEKEHDNDNAEKLYKSAIAMEPLWGTFRVRLAAYLVGQGRGAEAEKTLAKCQRIPTAADECRNFTQEMKFIEAVHLARQAYLKEDYLEMDKNLSQAYGYVIDNSGVTELSIGQSVADNLSGQGFSITASDWDLVGSIKLNNLAKFAYLLGLAYEQIGSERADQWLRRAIRLAPDWSYFYLEEMNYLLSVGKRSEVPVVLATCKANNNAREACLEYESQYLTTSVSEPVGKYRGEIENEITE